MAFPATPLLDDFNRADEGPPPSANWSAAAGGGEVISNELAGTSSTNNWVYWNVATFTAPEVWIAFPTLDPTEAVLAGVFIANTATFNGYRIAVDAGTSEWVMHRITGGGLTEIASGSQAVAAGDMLGLRRSGSSLEVWYHNGTAWALLDTVVDATYDEAQSVGVYLRDTTWRGDNFGGGQVTRYVLH